MAKWATLILLAIFGGNAIAKIIVNTGSFESSFACGSDTATIIVGRLLAESSVTMAGGVASATDGTRVEFDSDSVSTDATLIILEPEPAPVVPALDYGYRPIGIFREFILLGATLTTKVKLTLPCPKRPDIERYRIYWWNETEWIDQGGEVEDGFISTFTTHFSVYGVMGSSLQPDLSKVYCYPNPYRPSKGHNNITFTFLTEDIRMKVFNIAGEEVANFEETNGNGEYRWDNPKLASGVYIYLITSKNQKAVGKIGIVK